MVVILATHFGSMQLPDAFCRALDQCRTTAKGDPDRRTRLGRRLWSLEERFKARLYRRYMRVALRRVDVIV